MVPSLSTQQAQSPNVLKADTQSSEQQLEPICDVYRRIREQLMISPNVKETLKSFNSKNTFKKLRPEDQYKLLTFLRAYIFVKNHTPEQKQEIINHVTSLESKSQRTKEPQQTSEPSVKTSSGRVSHSNPKYSAYQRDLFEEIKQHLVCKI